MMESIVGAKAESRSVPEACMRMDQGGMQAGRMVQCEVADVRVSDQMAASSGTSWRTTAEYRVAAAGSSGAIGKTANAVKQGAFTIKRCEYKPEQMLATSISNSLGILEIKREKHKNDDVSFCVAVVEEINRLKTRYRMNTVNDDYKLLISQLGPLYVESLKPALEFIKSKAEDECGWEYGAEIELIGKYMELHEDDSCHESINRDLLKEIYQQLVDGEMRFLEYMKDCPVANAVKMSEILCDRLLNRGNKRFEFISPDKVVEINEKKCRLIETIKANLNKEGSEIYIGTLKEKVHDGIASRLDERLYFYVLQDKFLGLARKYPSNKGETCTPEAAFSCLRDLLMLRFECIHFLSELHSLPRDIEKRLTFIAGMIMQEARCNSVQLEERTVNLIMTMVADKVVSLHCGRVCLYCKELEFPPKSTMEIADRKDGITDAQCNDRLSAIESLVFREETPEKTDTINERDRNHEQAAMMLRQLLYSHMHEIEMLPTAERHTKVIEILEKEIQDCLFAPVVNAYYNAAIDSKGKKRTGKDLANAMNCYQHRLVQLMPYRFVVRDINTQEHLMQIAGYAWCNFVAELADKKTSFNEEDVDQLLALKRLMPAVSNAFLRSVLEKALDKFFQIAVSPDGVNGIPDEKIAALSQWVHDLDILKTVSEQLKTNHKLWEESHEHVTSKKEMTSSASGPSTSTQRSNDFQVVPGNVSLKRKQETVLESVVSKTRKVTAESQADLEKDKTHMPDSCDDVEQITCCIADNKMITE